MLEWEDSWIRLREHGVGGFRIWENGMKEKWSATLVLILLFPFLFIKKEKEKKKKEPVANYMKLERGWRGFIIESVLIGVC
jgi:hypothetical protein